MYNGNVTLKDATSSITPVKISAIFTGNDLYKPKTVQYALWIEENQEPPVPVQDTLDATYQAPDGIIQLYGDIVTPPTPPTPTQDTLDAVYESNNGGVQLYGQLSQAEII